MGPTLALLLPFITRITIVRSSVGMDSICITFDDSVPSPLPELESESPGTYPADCVFRTRWGYAEEWVKKAFGDSVEFRVIES